MSRTSKDEFVTTYLPPVVLGGRQFQVREVTFEWADRDGTTHHGSEVYLTGPRGAEYFLRGFLSDDTGVRQVISCASGAPLRVAGNEVRVIRIGDVIEQAPARRVRGLR